MAPNRRAAIEARELALALDHDSSLVRKRGAIWTDLLRRYCRGDLNKTKALKGFAQLTNEGSGRFSAPARRLATERYYTEFRRAVNDCLSGFCGGLTNEQTQILKRCPVSRPLGATAKPATAKPLTISVPGNPKAKRKAPAVQLPSVKSPTSTSTEVRSPTSTSTEVRSPTSTSTEVRSPTSTSTEAYTAGNVTVTGGAGDGATTSVTIYPCARSFQEPKKPSTAQLSLRSKHAHDVPSGPRAPHPKHDTSAPRARVPKHDVSSSRAPHPNAPRRRQRQKSKKAR